MNLKNKNANHKLWLLLFRFIIEFIQVRLIFFGNSHIQNNRNSKFTVLLHYFDRRVLYIIWFNIVDSSALLLLYWKCFGVLIRSLFEWFENVHTKHIKITIKICIVIGKVFNISIIAFTPTRNTFCAEYCEYEWITGWREYVFRSVNSRINNSKLIWFGE